MKKKLLHTALFLLASFAGSELYAQGELGMHFNRSLMQSSYTNPAFSQQGWSIGLPLVSSFGFAYNQKGLGYSDFFSKDAASGATQLDFNQAIGKMRLRNYLSTETSIDLLSGAYTNAHGSFGVNITERAFVRAAYSKDLMQLLWNGSASMVGQLPDYEAYLNATRYRETAIRYSKPFGKLELGARIKMLQGIHNLYIKKGTLLDLRVDTAAYAMSGTTSMRLQSAGMNANPSKSMSQNLFNMRNPGLGLDLGATYTILGGRFVVSASVVDLGGISWRDDVKNRSNNTVLPTTPINLNQGQAVDSASAVGLLDSIRAATTWTIDNTSYSSKLLPKSYVSVLAHTSPTVTWGFLIYTEYAYKPMVSMMLHYSKVLKSGLELGASYAYINGTASNIGLGMQWQHGFFRGFVNTDNVFSFFGSTHRLVYNEGTAGLYIPASAQVCALRAGIAITFVQKEQPNVPSIPF